MGRQRQRHSTRNAASTRGDDTADDPGHTSFATLLAAAKSGSVAAMEHLYNTYHAQVFRYVRSQAPVEAEDITADVFVAMVGRLDSFDGDENNFRSWIFSIAYRRLADERRRAVRRRDQLARLQDGHREQLGDVEAEASAAAANDAALRRIAGLPGKQAHVVLLRIVADLSVAEVATILSVSPGAVRALQLRALRRLARELGRSGP